MKRIDLNSDMGELRELIEDGTQEALMQSLTSVNVACGGHAGDEAMMRATIEQAAKRNVSVGAHPGYADRENFGRLELKLTAREIADSVREQLERLGILAEELGVPVTHVKPHGALYNQAALDREIASAIAKGVEGWRKDVVMVGLAGSVMLEVFRARGFPVAAEGFVDRRYEANGTLRSRKFPDALIKDPAAAARQALCIVERGSVLAWDGAEVQLEAQTLCVHGDTPGAVGIATAVNQALSEAGIELRGLGTLQRIAR